MGMYSMIFCTRYEIHV